MKVDANKAKAIIILNLQSIRNNHRDFRPSKLRMALHNKFCWED